jgi:DNA-binding transcriptional regulator YiaG
MPNLATTLKAEISRIARKEVRGEVESLRKAITTYRSEIAGLKRRAQALELEVRRLTKTRAKATPAPDAPTSETARRFSAKGFAKHRQRLGLTAADCGLLLGASGQSIYNWESGEARPQARHLAALAAFRDLGKKAALAHLEAIKAKT